MIWHRPGDLQQGKPGTQETFGLTVRQMEHFLHGQHNQNGLLAVLKLTAALLLHTIELFPLLSGELLSSLRSLSPADWARPTACAPWTVKDVAAHLLGGSIGRLWDDASRVLQPGGGAGGYGELVALINRDNEEWVRAARRISPGLLPEQLQGLLITFQRRVPLIAELLHVANRLKHVGFQLPILDPGL
jgi:hypothetical protein